MKGDGEVLQRSLCAASCTHLPCQLVTCASRWRTLFELLQSAVLLVRSASSCEAECCARAVLHSFAVSTARLLWRRAEQAGCEDDVEVLQRSLCAVACSTRRFARARDS